MDLTQYVENLRRDLAVVAEAGGEEAVQLAERLTNPLDSAVRLMLLNALSTAMDEITSDLAPGSVELRLRGDEPSFVVTLPPAEPPFEDDTTMAPPSAPTVPVAEDGATARINLRLPEQLKQRVDEAASAEGISVNSWLVRAASAALQPERRTRRTENRGNWVGDRITGWVR